MFQTPTGRYLFQILLEFWRVSAGIVKDSPGFTQVPIALTSRLISRTSHM